MKKLNTPLSCAISSGRTVPQNCSSSSDQWVMTSCGTKRCNKKSARITMEIFTKLLLMSMVASNSRGWSFNCKIRRDDACFSSCRDAKLLCVREKKATSEPEIKADANNKTTIEEKAPKISQLNPGMNISCKKMDKSDSVSKVN